MSINSKRDLDGLLETGRVVREALETMREAVRPGVLTSELNEIGAAVLARHDARSAPMVEYDFPAAVCISVNDEIVHGIPSGRAVQAGDLVKLDVTAAKDGYIADAAVTVPVPPVSEEKRALVACAEQAFHKALSVARAGNRVNHIGRAVEHEVRRNGFAVVRELAGHGVGRAVHEEPSVPNYYDLRARQRLTDGLVITIEPMVCIGSARAKVAADGWTIKTADGGLSAHYEHTIIITRGRPILATAA